MNRRREDLHNLDTSTWPTVDLHALSPAEQKIFTARRQAIEWYAAGKTVREIENQTGINSKQLYRLIDRCLAPSAQGQLFGFRGLLKYHRVRVYTRSAKLAPSYPGACHGFSGAFALLLERHPALREWLARQIRKHAVILKQISTDGKLQTRLQGLGKLHVGFIQQCRAVGITAADYPINTDRMGIRALSEYATGQMLNSFGSAARAAGAPRLKGLPHPENSASIAATRPYQIVEFDGHRLDVRLKIVVCDPLGFEQEFEIERVWLLAILDVCTRAVLGYHLALSREYSRYDVIKTIEKALTPHQPRTFSLPDVGYGNAGGFPSGKLPELGYAIWQRMRLDNAKANLADDTMKALCEFVGCIADAGPPHQPDDRPYIERFFGTVASTLSSRLPGYTGSNPQDLRRALSDPKSNLRLFVSLSELEELMEAALAGYNATPHAGINGRTPLEAMNYLVRGKASMITWLPEAKRRTLCLMQMAHRCRVRGYLAQGTRPHINLFQVRYTSEVLAASSTLLGKDLRVYYNSDDLRTVRAFLVDGTELGILKAQGAWGEVCHDLKLRREIMKLRSNKRMAFTVNQAFIDRFVADKKAKAKHSRRAASELERTLRMLANAPTDKTPPGPLQSSDAAQTPRDKANDTNHLASSSQKPKIEPQKLTIGSGYASG